MNNVKDLGHGPCLTNEEYEKKVVELYSNLSPTLSREQDREIRRLELELAIDHRLGKDFPKDRREALWEVKQRVEKKRLRLALKYLLRRYFHKWFLRQAQGLAGFMVEEYARVLNKDELQSFFGLEDGERPNLPIESGKP